jgi:protein TonB
MLGYAVETRPARRKASPTTLALIATGHAALILAVMNSKMNLPERVREPPIVVDTIKLPKDPLPEVEPQKTKTAPRTPLQPVLDRQVVIPIDFPKPIETDLTGTIRLDPGEAIVIPDPPKPLVRLGPKPLTPDHALRPPYPLAKRRLEEEAVLRLRLAIDEHGRVSAVDPVGAADPMFLASARNHLIRNWRYKPATEGGRPVSSSVIINLRFEIDET